VEGITIMLEDAKELNEKKLLSQIYETMTRTGIFYESLADTKVFPEIFPFYNRSSGAVPVDEPCACGRNPGDC